MSREDRIRLYKTIYSKYHNNAAKLPQDEKNEALKVGYLLSGYESFASHQEALETSKERIALIDKNEIADAFLYSLSTALCEYRSPLLSYYFIKSISPHEFNGDFTLDGKIYQSSYCNICVYDNEKSTIDSDMEMFSRSPFESVNYSLMGKYLFGTVSRARNYLDDCIMDITQYISLPKVKASARDKKIFIESLKLIETLKASDKAGAYIKLLYESKIIPNCTKGQITSYVDTLGSLNILHRMGDYAMIKGKDLYDNSYRDPVEHKNDHPFPLSHWRASDGVDWNEVQAIFSSIAP